MSEFELKYITFRAKKAFHQIMKATLFHEIGLPTFKGISINHKIAHKTTFVFTSINGP